MTRGRQKGGARSQRSISRELKQGKEPSNLLKEGKAIKDPYFRSLAMMAVSDSRKVPVDEARKIQQARFKKEKIFCNADMDSKHLKAYCTLDQESKGLLEMAVKKLSLSARAYTRIIKVARTIADLDRKEQIGPEHLSEAVQYRSLDREQWYRY